MLSPRRIPNKAEDRASVCGRHMARHSQREAVLHKWPATGRNMPDSAPCVCVFVPLLILSHVFIMRPLLLQLSRAERAGDEWSSRTGDPSQSRRRRQTERRKQSHEAAADFTLCRSIVRNPAKRLVMKIRGDGCLRRGWGGGGLNTLDGLCFNRSCSGGSKI